MTDADPIVRVKCDHCGYAWQAQASDVVYQHTRRLSRCSACGRTYMVDEVKLAELVAAAGGKNPA